MTPEAQRLLMHSYISVLVCSKDKRVSSLRISEFTEYHIVYGT